MDPLSLGIMAGTQLIGGLMSNDQQQSMNAQQMRFAIQMYERQRKDALADWNMQNEYNSPAMQMSRLKSAGLNPALVYGNGAVANNSSGVRSSSVSQPQLKAPTALADVIGNSFSSFMNLQTEKLQQDNLKKQNDVIETQNLLNLAKIANTEEQTKMTQFKRGLGESTLDNVIEVAQLKVKKMKQDLEYQVKEFDLKSDVAESNILRNSQSIAESMERILNYRIGRAKTTQEIENLKSQKSQIEQATKNAAVDEQLKLYEKRLNDIGMSKGDPLMLRLVNALMDKLTGGDSTGLEGLDELKKGNLKRKNRGGGGSTW